MGVLLQLKGAEPKYSLLPAFCNGTPTNDALRRQQTSKNKTSNVHVTDKAFWFGLVLISFFSP